MDTRIWTHGHMDAWGKTHGDIDRWTHGHMELKYWGILKFYTQKIKPLPLAHHANGSLSLVRLLVKKQTEVLTVNLQSMV
jgi:hypothetical protein